MSAASSWEEQHPGGELTFLAASQCGTVGTNAGCEWPCSSLLLLPLAPLAVYWPEASWRCEASLIYQGGSGSSSLRASSLSSSVSTDSESGDIAVLRLLYRVSDTSRETAHTDYLVPSALTAFKFMYDYPATAPFLTQPERDAVSMRLKLDRSSLADEFDMKYFWAAMKDWKIWVHMFITIGVYTPL